MQPQVVDDAEHRLGLVPVTGRVPSMRRVAACSGTTGSAESATTEMPMYTPSTAISTRLTAADVMRPGSFASSAMFETVSIPV